MSGLRETYVRLRMKDEASSVLHDVNSLMNQVVNNFQQFGHNIDTSTTGFNSMSQEVIRLNNRLDASTTEINDLRTGLSRSNQEMNELRNNANRMEMELSQAQQEIQELRNGMQGVNQQAKQASGIFSNIGATVAGIAASLGTVAFGATLTSDALEMDAAFGRLEARTGASGEALKEYEGIAKSLFIGGLADNIDVAADSVSTFSAMFGDLNSGQLEKVAAGAHTISKAWDQEAKEVGKTVSTMTKTFGGLGETRALDLITTAFQRTGDHSDDLLDTFNEYSTQFKALGYGAEGFTATLIAGAESGAFNFDKLADTAKEGFLKMGEGSKDTRSALTAMGLNADQVITGIGMGGEKAQQAFMGVSTALASVEDPAERNRLAIAAFGTPLEDLGPQFATFFGSVNQDLGNFEGATERAADSMQNTFGAKMTSAWRDLKVSMVEAFQTDGMQGFLGTVASDVQRAMPQIKAGFSSFADTISNNIMPAYEKFKTGLSWVIDNKETLISVGTGIAAGFAAFKTIGTAVAVFDKLKTAGSLASTFAKFTSPIGLATLAIGGLVAAGVYLYQNWDTVKEKAGILKDNLSSAWGQIKDGIGDAVSQVGGFFTGLGEKAVGLWQAIKENPMLLSVVGPIGAVIGAGMSLYQNWDTVKAKAGELWGAITERFAGIKSGVSNFVQPAISWFGSLGGKWDALKTKTVELWTTATEKFVGIKQAVSDFVQPAIGWFDSLSGKWNDFKSSISNFKLPEWMSKVGGAVSSGINKVKSWAAADGTHATGLARVGWDGYRAELHRGESVLTASQSDTLRGMGILSANSDGTPNIDLTPAISSPAAPTTNLIKPPSVSAANQNVQISLPFEINVNGSFDGEKIKLLEETIRNIQQTFGWRVQKEVGNIFRRELAKLEG